jgi:propanol-preferring alcohol dehydrogenase
MAESSTNTMLAAVLDGAEGSFELRQVPRPRPREDEVTVDVVAVGAGLTLLMARSGALGGTFPRIIGHEIGGVVRETGPGVTQWSPGDRVTTSFYLTCGECRWCQRGRETLCANFAGFVGSAVDGGFAETVCLPARNLVRVPDEVPLSVAGVVADAVATPLHVVNSRMRVEVGEWIAVIGAGGGLGIHMLQVLRARGARTIAVESDLRKREAIRAQRLADMVSGADWTTVPVAEIDGVAGVIDCVGSSQSLAQGVDALGPGGVLVVLGAAPEANVVVPGLQTILRELTITGTRYANRYEIAQALTLVATGRVEPIVGARYELEDIGKAFDATASGEVFGRVLIDVRPE